VLRAEMNKPKKFRAPSIPAGGPLIDPDESL
jgi:hypothetical protein